MKLNIYAWIASITLLLGLNLFLYLSFNNSHQHAISSEHLHATAQDPVHPKIKTVDTNNE